MQITKDMLMADVIHTNYLLLNVISRFEIGLGFGNKTVDEVCKENGVNIDFFLDIVNSFHDPDFFPDKELQKFSVDLIIKYLRQTHDYYLKIKIPEIESMINILIDSSTEENRESLSVINRFFSEYKKELIAHILREEDMVIPYILGVNDAINGTTEPDEVDTTLTSYSIDDFADEHNNVEDKLSDLKNIIIKFLPPVHDFVTCNNILIELFRLEKDLNNHARIEDKVLIPKVRIMETALTGRQ